MHTTSFNHVERLARKYLRERELAVIDIGAKAITESVRGDKSTSYRSIFRKHHYRGLDIEKGPNVDLVMLYPEGLPLQTSSVDVVVCGQVFEHARRFWLLWQEMVRVLLPSGYIFLVAPSCGPIHRYPVDCWRFHPDGFRALAETTPEMEVLETTMDEGTRWGDVVGCFQKR